MDHLFHDKAEEKIVFDIYSDPDQCDDRTALDTVVDCNSNPASTIAAAEILLRRLLQVIADLRTPPKQTLASESFGFDSVYSPLVKAVPRRKSQVIDPATVDLKPEASASAASASTTPENNASDDTFNRRSESSQNSSLSSDYLRNEYITLDASSLADWVEVDDKDMSPPSFGLRSPEISHLLENWTTDTSKVCFLCYLGLLRL